MRGKRVELPFGTTQDPEAPADIVNELGHLFELACQCWRREAVDGDLATEHLASRRLLLRRGDAFHVKLFEATNA